MSKDDSSRRSFLKRAAVGVGAIAGSGLVPDVHAQALEQHKDDAVGASRPTPVQHGAFFNYEQAATIAAFADRLMPGAPGKPGAHDAGVLNYIDLALAGAYADLQDFYRRGLTQLEAYAARATNSLSPNSILPSRMKSSELWNKAKLRVSTGPPRRNSSMLFALTRWKECSLTQSTEAIAISRDGAWWASLAPKESSHRRICRTNGHSLAHPSLACRPSRTCKRRQKGNGRSEPWPTKRRTSLLSALAR